MAPKQKPRDTWRYELEKNGKVVHRGITNDPDRRESEHQKEHPGSTLNTQGPAVTRESAREWERERRDQSKVRKNSK